ncbi:MAG: hypothetical protein CL693_04540 [Cellvibrionaceae bacterium]|nr:hypothetical protein [Cellvibrionaceae bacterium]|tara:strand:- start:2400 stop:3221 length:822 start_codon:yes stop_codon:yes gene_type:complete
MCTVTYHPSGGGYRLMMNRDEKRSREEAGLFRSRDSAEPGLSYPVDAVSGGSWTGLNQWGMGAALLNRYQASTIAGSRSRGEIIPSALASGGIAEVVAKLRALPVLEFDGFDLLLAYPGGVFHISWDGRSYRGQPLSTSQSLMLTSSSERLQSVSRYRYRLFRQWLASGEEQSHFHWRQEQGQETSAVLMSRAQVHTKSIVSIVVERDVAQLSYFPQQLLSANQPSKLSEALTSHYNVKPEFDSSDLPDRWDINYCSKIHQPQQWPLQRSQAS